MPSQDAVVVRGVPTGPVEGGAGRARTEIGLFEPSVSISREQGRLVGILAARLQRDDAGLGEAALYLIDVDEGVAGLDGQRPRSLHGDAQQRARRRPGRSRRRTNRAGAEHRRVRGERRAGRDARPRGVGPLDVPQGLLLLLPRRNSTSSRASPAGRAAASTREAECASAVRRSAIARLAASRSGRRARATSRWPASRAPTPRLP